MGHKQNGLTKKQQGNGLCIRRFQKKQLQGVAHFWQASPSLRPNPEGQKNKKP